MPRPANPKAKARQTRRMIRSVLQRHYPGGRAPNRRYDGADFIELASLAAARGQSLMHTSQAVPRLPDSDTFHAHLHAFKADDVLAFFQETMSEVLSIAHALSWMTPCPVALDRHDEPHYGKDRSFTVGCKNRRGTNQAHAYLTSQRLVDPRVSLDLQRVHPFRSQHEALRDLLKTTESRQEATRYLVDKAFYNAKDLALLADTRKDFVVAVPQVKMIQRVARELIRHRQRVGFGRFVATRRHRVADQVDVVLVFHWEPDAESKTGEQLFVYATNRERPPEEMHALAKEYRTRWGIETGYRLLDRW